MPTDKDSTAEALSAHLQRMSESVERISARIARLATVLDVDLQNDSALDRLLNMDGGAPGGHERRVSGLPPTGASPTSRKSCAPWWCCATASRAVMYNAWACKPRGTSWSMPRISWNAKASNRAPPAPRVRTCAVCLTVSEFPFFGTVVPLPASAVLPRLAFLEFSLL